MDFPGPEGKGKQDQGNETGLTGPPEQGIGLPYAHLVKAGSDSPQKRRPQHHHGAFVPEGRFDGGQDAVKGVHIEKIGPGHHRKNPHHPDDGEVFMDQHRGDEQLDDRDKTEHGNDF